MQNTKRVLESRFFATDPLRTDIKLGLARLASVLHYRADRSVVHGIAAEEKTREVHRYIDRVTENQVPAEISMRGYVISLAGDEGFKKKYGEIPLTVLAADDLGQLGFTTLLRGTQSDVSNDDASPPSTYPQPMHEPQPTAAWQPTPALQMESAPELGPRRTPKPQIEAGSEPGPR